jgi:hypothetical protein
MAGAPPAPEQQQQQQCPWEEHQLPQLREGPHCCWHPCCWAQEYLLQRPQQSCQWRWLSPLLLARPCRPAQRGLQEPSCQRQNQTQPHGHAGEGQQEPAKPGAPGSRRWLGAQAR